jgi:O-methyltransferase involved in polyketide biosynthesis
VTALLVAAIPGEETRRPERLFEDRFAEATARLLEKARQWHAMLEG